MRMRTVLMTVLAFVGLVVGAGFATGQEVLQYFISFGAIGIVGAVLSGINYACMNMMLAVSMSLVIGGNLPNTREARWGGFFGVLTRAVRGVVAAPPCADRARDRSPRSHPRPADAARGPAPHLHPEPREAPRALRRVVGGL